MRCHLTGEEVFLSSVKGDSVVAVAGLGITQEAFDKTVSCKEGLVPVWIAPKLCFVN
jgi:hypothetical protein